MARGLKFQIKIAEGLYYPCSKNKGADQLRGHRKTDLRLCFSICKNLFFSLRGSNNVITEAASISLESTYLSHVMRKSVCLVLDWVRHKHGCTATEDD